MNSTYHIEAPTREEFDAILQRMIDDQDPALCCANVEWKKVPKKVSYQKVVVGDRTYKLSSDEIKHFQDIFANCEIGKSGVSIITEYEGKLMSVSEKIGIRITKEDADELLEQYSFDVGLNALHEWDEADFADAIKKFWPENYPDASDLWRTDCYKCNNAEVPHD